MQSIQNLCTNLHTICTRFQCSGGMGERFDLGIFSSKSCIFFTSSLAAHSSREDALSSRSAPLAPTRLATDSQTQSVWLGEENPSDYTWEGGPKGRDSVVHQGFQLESPSIREAGRQAPLPRVEGAPYPTAKEDRDAAWPERGIQWRSWWKPITPGILCSPTAAGQGVGCRDFTCTEEHCSGNGHAMGTGTAPAPRQRFSPTLSPPELQLKTHRRRLSIITVRSSLK